MRILPLACLVIVCAASPALAKDQGKWPKDAVDMTLFFMENNIGGLFNVGSGKANTWNALASAIFRALDRKPNVEFIDMPESIRDKYQYHTEADITLLRGAGYEGAITPLAAGVADYVQNYLVPRKHLGE